MMWLGVFLFWLIQVVVIILCKCCSGSSNFTQEVLFYGAYELAKIVAERSDELNITRTPEQRDKEAPWWKGLFIYWWAFSIKYFIPWALLSLMMWNFKADIDLKNDRGYGGYHDVWQVVGFIYPLIGLLCFFIPICFVTTPEAALQKKNEKGEMERIELKLDNEEHPKLKECEELYVKALEEAKEAVRRTAEIMGENKK